MALDEGVQYGLHSKDGFTSENVSCVHVKLTDSALKIIEDTLRAKRGGRPSIEIGDEQGLIKIPAADGSNKEFTFTVSALTGDPNGSFDCIQQKKNKKLVTLDSMTQKIVVKATDEVYQTTRDRMAVQNEESKKNCAKEIDQTKGGIKAKKVTIKRANGSNIPSRPIPSKPTNERQLASATSSRSPTLPTLSPTRQSPMTYPASTMAPSANYAKKLDQMKRKNLKAHHNTSASSRNKANEKSDQTKAKAALLTVPLRERIIHVLASKPNYYKTPDLIAKFKSDGLSSNDTGSDIVRILNETAVTNSKECWSLKKEYLNEVDMEWPHYSHTDKQLLRRAMDRAKAIIEVDDKQLSESEAADKRKHKSDKKSSTKSKKSKLELSDDKNGNKRSDFHTVYTKISSLEQRNRYKNDFNQEHDEYMELYNFMILITEKFQALQKRLDSVAEGSGEHSKIEKEIRKEYKAVKQLNKFDEKKQRLEYLHRKLAHIKKIVNEFDETNLNRTLGI